jgi:uncharacterized membrane protein
MTTMMNRAVRASDRGKTQASVATRDAVADLLKGTAVVLMVQVHLMELFARPDVLASWPGKVSLFLGGPPAAPLFLLVMGYYLAASTRSTGGLLLRGLKLLALGGLLNLGLNAHVLMKIVQGALPFDPRPFILGVDILFVAGASTMLLALFRPLLNRALLATLAAALLVILFSPWMTRFLTTTGAARWGFAYVAGIYEWSYFPCFPWLAYPLLGFAWHQGRVGFSLFERSGGLEPTLQRLVAAGIAIACAVGTAMTCEFALTVCNDLPRYYHHDLWFFLWVCAFLVAWIGLHRLCERWFGTAGPLRWLKDLGRNVTLCYVIQWLLIGNVATALYKSETLLHWALWVVVILTATTLLTRLLVIARRKVVGK